MDASEDGNIIVLGMFLIVTRAVSQRSVAFAERTRTFALTPCRRKLNKGRVRRQKWVAFQFCYYTRSCSPFTTESGTWLVFIITSKQLFGRRIPRNIKPLFVGKRENEEGMFQKFGSEHDLVNPSLLRGPSFNPTWGLIKVFASFSSSRSKDNFFFLFFSVCPVR